MAMGIIAKDSLTPTPLPPSGSPDSRPLDQPALQDLDFQSSTIRNMNFAHGASSFEGSSHALPQVKMERPPHGMDPWTHSPGQAPPPVSQISSASPQPAKDAAGSSFYPRRTPTPSSMPPLCAGCRLRIIDKFYLCAVEAKWHTSCLKCFECGVNLENQLSCFERDGNIYCKDDYVRIFANKCFRCLQKIQPTDLVMKARNCLFHVDCFRCATCDANLKKGDLFGMFEDVPYCQLHYELVSAAAGDGQQPPPGFHQGDHLNSHSPVDGVRDGYQPPPMPPGGMGFPPSYGPPPGSQMNGDTVPPGWFPGPPCPDFPVGGGGDFPYDNNNEPRLKKQRGRKKRKVETFAAMNGYIEAGGYPPGMDGPGGGKTKRARTSFKHHQLRIMKAHFQINQNPDSRELKMLSQKTQLDKKVLQVWFQNARAKWRRTKAQDGSGAGGQGGMMGGSSIPPAPNSSSSGMSGPEDGDMAGASPSSDCSGPIIACC